MGIKFHTSSCICEHYKAEKYLSSSANHYDHEESLNCALCLACKLIAAIFFCKRRCALLQVRFS